MGYYNDSLAHSSGPWKKHKYTQKIGEGANAVYRYAKKKGAEIADAAGVDERAEWKKKKGISDRYDKLLEDKGWENGTSSSDYNDTFTKKVDLSAPHDEAIRQWKRWQEGKSLWQEQGRDARNKAYAAHDKEYEARRAYAKTPLGAIETSTAFQKGQKAIANLFKKKK